MRNGATRWWGVFLIIMGMGRIRLFFVGGCYENKYSVFSESCLPKIFLEILFLLRTIAFRKPQYVFSQSTVYSSNGD